VWEHNGSIKALGIPRKLPAEFKGFLPLIWEEHCTECAVPSCYQNCALYDRRPDGACRRFENGIELVSSGNQTASKIQFKRWGKLESPISGKNYSSSLYPYFEFVNNFFWLIANRFTSATGSSKIQVALSWRRRRWVARNELSLEPKTRILLVEVVESAKNAVLIVEVANSERVFFSSGLTIPEGKSSHHVSIPPEVFRNPDLLIRIVPSGDEGVGIVFGLLELVDAPTSNHHQSVRPAEFVKCVVWDLDNTLWEGVISENQEPIRLRQEVIEMIEVLDSRGILNSISSKNDESEVIPKLTELGILDYFLVPKINWLPKSTNIIEIASSLDINLDTLLFIDDSEFELAEVTNSLKQVRTRNSLSLGNLLNETFLNPKVSSESRTRRKMYQEDLLRKQIAHDSALDYRSFLLGSKLELSITNINSTEEFSRTFELLSRTNQLNISGNKYTFDELGSLVHDKGSIWLIGHVKDRYGSYGQVLVSKVVSKPTVVVIEELAISCRVAERRVEDSFIQYIRDQKFGTGKDLLLKFIESGRNLRMKETLKRIGFQETDSGDFLLDQGINLTDSSIVKSIDLQ
jgi:FkbH-like protein